jgi:hypothetical protein
MCLVDYDAMRLEDRVDVSGCPSRVISQSHRCAAYDINIRDDTAAHQAITEPSERILDSSSVEERIAFTHATSSSCGATKTPRLRNAAGA